MGGGKTPDVVLSSTNQRKTAMGNRDKEIIIEDIQDVDGTRRAITREALNRWFIDVP